MLNNMRHSAKEMSPYEVIASVAFILILGSIIESMREVTFLNVVILIVIMFLFTAFALKYSDY